MEDKVRQPTRIHSVARAARLLMLIASDPNAGWRPRTLADELGTSVPTMYHLLNTLLDAGLVGIDERGTYCLGIAVGQIAAAYNEQVLPPRELLMPLRTVSAKTGESAYLSAWRNGEMAVIVQLAATLPVRVTDLRPGFLGVAHARAAGKVLLALTTDEQRERYLAMSSLEPVTSKTITDMTELRRELDAARENRYAVEYEEFCEGVGCLSVPIVANLGLLGAYTVSAPIDRLMARQTEYLNVLQEAAAEAAAGANRPESRNPATNGRGAFDSEEN